MAANARGTKAEQRMVDGAIPAKREREQPDEENFEYLVERDMVKRFKSNYWGDPAASPAILQRYGPLFSRLDAEDNEAHRLLREIREWRARGCYDDAEAT